MIGDEHSDDDFLGFEPTAEAIANAIVQPDLAVSVFALTGPWGSGKSWTIRRVKSRLRAATPRPIVVEVDAWALSEADDYASAFLNELGSQLKEKARTQDWWNLWRRHRLRRIGRRLRGYGAAFEALAEAVVSPALKLFRALRAFWTPPSLAKRRRRVADALDKSPARIVVVVDDVDRLAGDELLVLLKLLRSLGDLPNVVYLIACDPAVLARALPETVGDEPDRHLYLQKFLQVSWNLPAVGVEVRLSFLDEVLLRTVPQWRDWTAVSGFEFGSDGPDYGPLVPHARAAIRIANQTAVLPNDVRRDLDLADVVYLEAVRVARPDVWAATAELFDRFIAHRRRRFSLFDTEPDIRVRLHQDARIRLGEQWDHFADGICEVLPFLAEHEARRNGPVGAGTRGPDDAQDAGRLGVPLNAAHYFRATRPDSEGISPERARKLSERARGGESWDALVRDLAVNEQVDVPRIYRGISGTDVFDLSTLSKILGALPDDLSEEAGTQWTLLLTEALRAAPDDAAATRAVSDWLDQVVGVTRVYEAIVTAAAWANDDDRSDRRDSTPALASDLQARVAQAATANFDPLYGIDSAIFALSDEQQRTFWRGADPRLLARLLEMWHRERIEQGSPYGWGDRHHHRGLLPGGALVDWFGDEFEERLREASETGLSPEVAAEAQRVVELTRLG